MYTVKFASKRVEKEYVKSEKSVKKNIEIILTVLENNPKPVQYGYESLNKFSEIKRIKFKRERVFYIINEEKKEIIIGKIDQRTSNSYNCDMREWFRAAA